MEKSESTPVGFGGFLRGQLAAAAIAGAALGLLLALLIVYVGQVNGDITLDIGFERFDALWFLLLSPLILALLFLLLSPLSFTLVWLWRRAGPGRR